MKELKKYAECNRLNSCTSCTNYNHCLNWKNFILKHNELKLYSHFDKKTASLRHSSIRQYVMNKENIIKMKSSHQKNVKYIIAHISTVVFIKDIVSC